MARRVIFAGLSVHAEFIVIDEEGGHKLADRSADVRYSTIPEARAHLLPGLYQVMEGLEQEFGIRTPEPDPTAALDDPHAPPG